MRPYPPWNKLLAGAAALAVALGVWARLWHLGLPDKQVFDEVYFPVFAYDYLHGVSFFDVHPPLGKFLIAAGIAAFGNTPFAWRIVPALFGIGLVGMIGWAWWTYSKDRASTLFLVAAAALEPIYIAYSRTGLMDGIQLFFIMACFGYAARLSRKRQLVGLAVLLGLAAAIKWVALGVSVPAAYLAWRKGLLREFVLSLPIGVLAYGFIAYAGQVLIGAAHPLDQVFAWHSQAFEYHLRLTATHPWASPWYTWPLMLRPVLFLYDANPDGTVSVMTAIGNPVLWWVSTAAVVASVAEVLSLALLRRKVADHPLVPLLVGYAACLLPWIPIHRVVFLYHYIPCYAFATMMVAYWFARAWSWRPAIGALFAVGVLGTAVFFLPFAMGRPLNQDQIKERIWVNSWLYG